MGKAPDLVYRATNPAAVEASLDRYNQARRDFFETVEKFSEEIGHEVVVVGDNTSMYANHLDGDWRRDGLYEKGEKVTDIPPGWHYYVKEGRVQPHRGGKDQAARDLRARLKEINASSPSGLGNWLTKEFGIKGSPPFNSYGFEPVGDDFFVLMRRRDGFGSTYDWEGNEHFEKVAMSTYWLAKESQESVDV